MFQKVTRLMRYAPFPVRLCYWTALYYYNRRKWPDGSFTIGLYRSYANKTAALS
jgi:hypothetical protein